MAGCLAGADARDRRQRPTAPGLIRLHLLISPWLMLIPLNRAIVSQITRLYISARREKERGGHEESDPSVSVVRGDPDRELGGGAHRQAAEPGFLGVAGCGSQRRRQERAAARLLERDPRPQHLFNAFPTRPGTDGSSRARYSFADAKF